MRFRSLLEGVPSLAVQSFDRDGKVLYWNKGSEALYGFTVEEALGHSILDLLVPPARHGEAREVIAGMFDRADPLPPVELELLRKDGSPISVYTCHSIVRLPGKPAEVFSIDLDLTEQKRAEEERKALEEQVRQAQKMESIGRLAGGVAHDFNNMLCVILGHGELLRHGLDPSSRDHDHVEEIMRAGERSADLTRQLLAFARRQPISPRVLDLNETVASMLKMLRRLIGEHIELVWKPAGTLWPLRMDPAQVDQILTNLMVNARDAISDAGRIVVETRNIELSEEDCRHHHSSIAPGCYVVLVMSDSGAGMSHETRERIFEPFFTTKEVGQGTGLGLATVYGIVKQNDGYINVYSEPGKGTTFRIYLPRFTDAQDESSGIHAPPAIHPGRETILLVEDEEALLTLGRVLLERLGYTVLAFDDPRAAIDAARTHEGEIDLLMTDVVMPGLSGREVWQAVHEARPATKCLFVSGYASEVIARYDLSEEGIQFLQKPFTMFALAQKLRETLDG